MQKADRVTSFFPERGICLIVEDNEFDSIKLRRIMEKSPYKMQIKVASSLSRAREVLSRTRTELILLDNNLPDGLGANFAIELSRNKKLRTIPVILISDWPSPFMWEKADAAGVCFVLNKSEFDARYAQAALQQARQQPAITM